MAEEKALKLTDEAFEQEVLNAELPVLVDFWAAWCGPCQMMGPIIEELASEYEGKVKVCKLNVDEGQQTASRYGVMSIPTLIIFKGGDVVDQIIGAVPKQQISAKLDKLL